MTLERDRQNLLAILGISAGVATGVAAGYWWWRRRSGSWADEMERWGQPRGSAQDVAEAFRNDARLSRRRIDVDTIAEGVVELSGSVRDRDEAARAVGIAQGTTGVYTVVNRLRVEDEESHRELNQRRRNDGAPDLAERKHYGMGVGMGARRHSPATDPDRPSDKQHMIERELDVRRVDDDAEPSAEDGPAMDAMADVEMKPGDEDAIREAGLDPSPQAPTDAEETVPDNGPEGEREERG